MPSAPTTIHRDCPLCGSDDATLVLGHAPWRLVQCAGCALAYLPEVPSDQQIDTTFEWSESFARARLERWARNPFARLWTGAAGLIRPRREGRALRRVRAARPSGRLLDVGCGDGRLLLAAERAGYDVLGVEASPNMAARARWRIGESRVLCGRLADFDLGRDCFDIVVTVSYLEHEPAPLQVMQRILNLLRPGGACVHKVPNYDSRLRRLLGSRWSGFRWPEHVQYYTPQTLERLMVRAGFELTHIAANPWSDNFWLTARRPIGNGHPQ